jgi:uncharacterized protein (TIGR03083 family)
VNDIGAVYADGRLRLSELVLDLDDPGQRAPVPTCPRWTVHDVIAHLTGICADILAGNIDGVTTDPWTEAQVSRRKDRTTAEVVAEWSEVAPQVEAVTAAFPEGAARQWVADLTTHEHDVRTAVGRPGARDSEGVEVAVDFLVTMGLHSSLNARHLPPLRVRAEGRDWVAGDNGEQAPAELEASAFELCRALTGRRSAAQIRNLSWTGDPEPYLPAFEYGPFTITPTDITE